MSDLAQRIDLAANRELLIQQWRRAPRMRGLTEAVLGVVDDHLIQPLADLERQFNIETADGFWLDCIGERLRLPRSATNLGNFAFFGFDGSGGVGFDQGPLASVTPALSPRVPVGDEFYRQLLKMRAKLLLSDSSVLSLESAGSRVFPGIEYRDNGDMTVGVRSVYQGRDFRHILAALDAVGGLPSPAGVELSSVMWEYMVGGDCEGTDSPVVIGQTAQETNVSAYERSDQQAHSGDYSWKITVEQDSDSDAGADVFPSYDLLYTDLMPLTQLKFGAWVYVDSGTSDDLDLSDVYLDLVCGDEDAEGNLTLQSNESESPSAFDTWEYLEATVTPTASCEVVRLALRISDRSAAHVVYWDDVSFRSES